MRKSTIVLTSGVELSCSRTDTGDMVMSFRIPGDEDSYQTINMTRNDLVMTFQELGDQILWWERPR